MNRTGFTLSRRWIAAAFVLPLLAAAGADAPPGAVGVGRAHADAPRESRSTLALRPASTNTVYMPLAARRQNVLDRPVPPTVDVPTAAPTALPPPTATVFACPPLDQRLRVRAIDVHPLEVKVKRGRYQGTSPIFVAPDPVGEGAHVAWSDTVGGVHVTRLDHYNLPVGPAHRLDGEEVRGLVVHEDGVALLVVRGDSLYLARLDAAGAVRFETRLVGGGSQDVAGNKWIDSWGHEARLVWAEGRYGVYSGHTQQFGAQGKHQGDLLWFFDADGGKLDRGDDWDWGCSHSLDLRLAHNGRRFGPVCLSDAYPAKGFHFNHRTKQIRSEPSGDGRGYSAANLGGWVPLPDGFLMSFTSPEGRESSDVGLIRVGNDAEIGPVTWLTDSADVAESEPHLARFGTRFLAGWTADSRHLVAVLDDGYAIEEGPLAIDAPIAARDDMVTFPNGDVVWAYAWDDYGMLKVVRLEACDDTVAPTAGPPATEPAATPTTPGTPDAPGTPPTGTPDAPGTPPTGTPDAPGTPPTGTPLGCRELLANGDFERGLDEWAFDGEVALRSSDRSGGRYGAMLLGRNAVTGLLRQSVAVPAGASAVFLTYWWRVSSDEPLQLSRAYDTVAARLAPPGSTPPPLEVLSNLARRDTWLPSAHRGPLGESRLEVSFGADSNGRDASRITIDDVSVVACIGTTPEWPVLAVEPNSVAGSAPVEARARGLLAGEMVSHWLLQPGTVVRLDLGTAAADALGELRAVFEAPAMGGQWTWAATGHQQLLPARASFTVTGSQ